MQEKIEEIRKQAEERIAMIKKINHILEEN